MLLSDAGVVVETKMAKIARASATILLGQVIIRIEETEIEETETE